MNGENNTDADIAYVVRHPRFVGVSPAPRPVVRGTGTVEYIIRIVDDAGHEIVIVGPLTSVFRTAADALRRMP